MAVGKDKPVACEIIKGVRLAAVEAGIRYANRRDLVLIEIDAGASVAGVTTRNAFCAAPVQVVRENLQSALKSDQSAKPSFFLINTGNANAGTGAAGLEAARQSCSALADIAQVPVSSIYPFSTGVIGELLPAQKLIAALENARNALQADAWEAAARGIMTTDTRPKGSSRSIELKNGTVRLSGIAKGAGMLKPNMATMLAFLFTDARISAELLQELVAEASNQSFNRITVDGDTSTNDCFMLAATGKSGVVISKQNPQALAEFRQALNALSQDLATQLIRDAEGASKFITIEISGGLNEQECLQVGYCVAESPLVKTAFFASDPNWGRILAAVGRAGLENLDLDKVVIRLGDTLLVENGGLSPAYQEAAGQAEMDKAEIAISIDLGRGNHQETLWTSDLSHEYVRINAEYRT